MRRRKDPFEKPWVIIAAGIGIIAVIAAGLLFFMGGGESSPETTTHVMTTTASSIASQTVAAGVPPAVIKTQVPVTVPPEGIYVRVGYIGGFAGTYGAEGNMISTRNSGDRFFAVENATGPISATFHKEDASTRHEIVVEIFKDGKSQVAARNSSSYGIAAVSAMV